MSTLKKVKQEAEKLGATVTREREGLSMVLRVTVPHRKIWNEGNVHEFVDEVYTGPNDYKDVLSRMSFGLCDCVDPECDWCCEEEDV